MRRSGLFITFEGPDGSGKTAQLKPLIRDLKAVNLPIISTREPGGTSIGNQIRATLLDLENTAMIDRTEALLYQAARAQLVEEVIKPHLEQGGIVLSDRYTDSTLAYQGFGHQNPLDSLENIIAYATSGLTPDCTVLLDIDPAVGLQRRVEDGDFNRLDAYDLSFHQRVREGYLTLAERDPNRWVVVDAGQTFDEVQKELRGFLFPRLQQAGFPIGDGITKG